MTTQPKSVMDMSDADYRQARADLLRGGPARTRNLPAMNMTADEYARSKAALCGGNINPGAEQRQNILAMSAADYQAAKAKFIRDSANS